MKARFLSASRLQKGLALLCLASGARAFAVPEYLDDLATRYKKSPSIKKYGCTLCHHGDPAEYNVNAFGGDYDQMINTKSAPTEADYEALLAKDSNGNGKSNREELAAGTNPGAAVAKKKK